MKKISKVILFSLPVIASISFFFSFDTVWEYIKAFSYDGEIKPTTKEFYNSLFNKVRVALLILSFLPVLYLLFFDRLSALLNKFVRSLNKKIQVFNSYISLNLIFILAFIISIAFMISAVFLFDIGQDPSYYLNDLQNIEKYGTITRDYDTGGTHIYLIPNLPFNILSYIYVKLFGFSVIGIRFIIVLFSLLFIYSLYLYLEKEVFKYSFILIFSIPGFYSLTSEIFLEITAISFIILSLFYLNKFEVLRNRKFEYLAILSLALAFTTKFQLIVYLFLVFSLMILYETDSEKRKFLLLFLIKTYFLIFVIVIATIIPFGFKEMLVYLNWYFVSNTAEGRAFLLNSDLKLFMVNEIIFIPLFILVIFLYYKYSNEAKKIFSFHFISIFSIINIIYWLFFFSSVTWRNIIYANIFVCIMLATILAYKKSYAKIVLLAFLLSGIITNLVFLHHGVVDDVQFLKEHFKAIVFTRDISQKTFFQEASRIIESEANVYVPALPYLSRVHLNNRRVTELRNFTVADNKKSYLIYDKDAFGEKEFIRVKEKEFSGGYKKVLEVGDYYLYEILQQ